MDVSVKDLQEGLLAIQDLRRKYLGEPQITRYRAEDPDSTPDMNCPLCEFNRQQHSGQCLGLVDEGVEDGCPWWWFEGICCTNSEYRSQSYKEKLARIDRWEEEIGRRLQKSAV